MEATYQGSVADIFNVPARLIIAGYSNSGKSVLCRKIIEKYHSKFKQILYCGVDSHPLQDNNEIGEKMIVSSEILNPFEYVFNNGDGNLLFVLDDCFFRSG